MSQIPELLDQRQIELFNALEELKKLNVASDIIPQLVVIGDQCNGKSSVLEGLVRFHFPVSEARCTQFPINLILKRSDEKREKAWIKSVEHSKTSSVNKSTIQAFTREASFSSQADMKKLIDEAGKALGVSSNQMDSNSTTGNSSEQIEFKIAEEMLVIEKHGPDLPILSFIDLPGLFQGDHSLADEVSRHAVERMVEKQIEQENNVVLLVISASSDLYNQRVVRKFQDRCKKDKGLGDRTIGVITKPDIAHEFERAMLKYVKKGAQNVELKRGWHVVRNLDKGQRNSNESLDERDSKEAEYFQQEIWHDIPEERKGIKHLRTTLTSIQWTCTENALPQIIERVRGKIAEIEKEVEAADKARANDSSRRVYLNDIARRFAELTSQAVTARYRNPPCGHSRKLGEPCEKCRPFFPEPRKGYNPNDPEGQKTKLCSIIRGLNALFAVTMREFGKTEIVKRVVEAASNDEESDGLMSDSENGASAHEDHRQAHNVEDGGNWNENPEDNNQADRVENDVNSTVSVEIPGNGSSIHQEEYQADRFPPKDIVRDYYNWPKCNVISQKEYEKKVVEIIKRNRGTEPIGEVNSIVYRDLFLDQSLNWKDIATNHIKAVWRAANIFVDLALEHVCWDKKVLRLLRSEIIKPNLDKLEEKANSALQDLLECLSEGNAGFFDSFSAVFTVQRQASDIAERLDTYGWNGLETEYKDDLVATIRVALDHLIHSPLGFLSVEDRLKDLVIGKALSIAIPAIKGIGKNKDENMIRAKILEFYPAEIQSQDAGRVTGIVEAYYKLTMLAFTGYVNALVVDKCILRQLETAVFGQAILDNETQDKINKIAAEDKDEVERREQNKKDRDALKRLLKVLERD